MEIRPLRQTDDRAAFRSGDPDLDRFLAKYAGQNQFRHHIGTTYVAVDDGRIVGYATVAAGQVEGENLSAALRRKLPGYPLPVLRLARLAVDSTAQDRGVGKALLRHVFLLALKMSELLAPSFFAWREENQAAAEPTSFWRVESRTAKRAAVRSWPLVVRR